jgi:hypothetical protein
MSSDWLPPIQRPERERSESSPGEWIPKDAPAATAAAEPAAPPSPQAASASTIGAVAVRLLVVAAVFLVIAGSPLFLTRRSVCRVDGRPQTHWSLVAPFDDSGPAGCDNQLGGSVLVDEVGLK